MNIQIERPIGGGATLKVNLEGDTEKETLSKIDFYNEPNYCGLCKGTNILWRSNKGVSKKDNKTYTYIKRLCMTCRGTSTAGTYQDGSGLFWKQWEPKFEGEGGGAAPKPDGFPTSEEINADLEMV